jgi:hypothetical protein
MLKGAIYEMARFLGCCPVFGGLLVIFFSFPHKPPRSSSILQI